jgi:hypothetical protein
MESQFPGYGKRPASAARVLAIFSAALQPGQEQISKGHIPRAAAIFGASICCKNNDGNCLISRKYIQR